MRVEVERAKVVVVTDGLQQSMTIWSVDNHVRHPWFDGQAKKRKHTFRDRRRSTSSDESDTAELHPAKRRRCSILEQGLADLSLQHNLAKTQTSLGDEDSCIGAREPTVVELLHEEEAMDADEGVGDCRSPKVLTLLPSSIEEPEQDIPEVQMKTSSWYELGPDRIVITDLDLFELEDDSVGGSGNTGVTINASFLEHIKKREPPVPRELLASPTSQALVLFRPPPPLVVSPKEMQEEDRVAVEAREAMEVEPMEIET